MCAFSLYFHKYLARFRQNTSFWRLDDKTFKCPALYLPVTDLWSEYAMIGPFIRDLFRGNYFSFSFSLNGGNPSPDYERRRGSSGTAIGGGNSSNAHMRTAASVDRLNLMGEGNTGRKLPSMPDSMQRSPMKISGREGEIAALKRSSRRSASSHNLVNSTEGKKSFLFSPTSNGVPIIDRNL